MANLDRDYDEVLYPSYEHAQTHPDRLSVIAMLAGMDPAPVQHCRVLELGCGDGSNLIPMAAALPHSEFVGIDRASIPITKGKDMLAALMLNNISLEEFDLLDLRADVGAFDYIIVHGLYAWVPDHVKDQVMSICRTHLKPHGVAYISYNAYPGSHIADMLRNMLLFHLRDVRDPKERISQSVAFLKFLSKSQTRSSSYSTLLDDELKQALNSSTALLYHDRIGAVNTPMYFFQFMNHAAQHGLQFLGEADYFECQYHIYPPETAKKLEQMANESVILKEQYLDFLKCRRFRQTLLCRAELKLNSRPNPRAIVNMHVASRAKPVDSAVDLSPGKVAEFVGPHGGKIATDLPVAKAALIRMAEIFPRPLAFAELLDTARQLVGTQTSDDAEALSSILLSIYGTGLLDLYPRAPDYVAEVGEYPMACPLVRLQVERGSIVTNLRHITIEVNDELGRHLLKLLDGTRNRSKLLDDLTQAVIEGNVLSDEQDATIPDTREVRETLTRGLEENLQKLAKLALLVQ
ncbi:MAG TPA: class I SAM-dependent methyltransferase [Pyrinomonadaceae bacterium]|nr:class I SAM-dependent methyltransferase [Pyrinomonadaceae bacterium]